METLAERARRIAHYYNMSLVKWQETMGLSSTHFYNCRGVSRKLARLIEEKYSEVSIDWLATGNGNIYGYNSGLSWA